MDYNKHYNRLIERAKSRYLNCYTEEHHITPKCLGGDDSKENLVRLTSEEHYIAHLLLVKIYPDHHGLVWAAIQMTGHSNGQRDGNKKYGWLKRKYQQVAKARVGEANGSYGSIWINRIGTVENKKHPKEEEIPEGWQRGRRLNRDRPALIEQSVCLVCNTPIRSESSYCTAHRNSHEAFAEKMKMHKDKSIELFCDYMQSEYKTINEFCESIGAAQPNISRSWRRHIVGYSDVSKNCQTKEDYRHLLEQYGGIDKWPKSSVS